MLYFVNQIQTLISFVWHAACEWNIENDVYSSKHPKIQSVELIQSTSLTIIIKYVQMSCCCFSKTKHVVHSTCFFGTQPCIDTDFDLFELIRAQMHMVRNVSRERYFSYLCMRLIAVVCVGRSFFFFFLRNGIRPLFSEVYDHENETLNCHIIPKIQRKTSCPSMQHDYLFAYECRIKKI